MCMMYIKHNMYVPQGNKLERSSCVFVRKIHKSTTKVRQLKLETSKPFLEEIATSSASHDDGGIFVGPQLLKNAGEIHMLNT